MHTPTELVKKLKDHFDANGWPLDINSAKLDSRARISSDKTLPGLDIVEIERHRPILGDGYVQGLEMNAFETYYMRYAVHVSNSEVKELPDRHGSFDININGLVSNDLGFDRFSLTIEAIDENSYIIREDFSKEEAVISTLEEAKRFSATLQEAFVNYFVDSLGYLAAGSTQIDESYIEELISDYTVAIKEGIFEITENKWNERELWES